MYLRKTLLALSLVCFAGSLAVCAPSAFAAGADAAHYTAPKAPAVVNDWSKDEFQYKFLLLNPYNNDSKKTSARSNVYLYIPPQAKKLKAFLLFQQNVVEQKMSVHPAIRKVCDANDIAIAWCNPGFDLSFDPTVDTKMPQKQHELIQKEFGKFGASIGYPELGTVPLIVFGHSNTTSYAQRGAEGRPDRVLAAIVTHGWNGVTSFHNYKGPVLLFIGTYMEQQQQDKPILSNNGLNSLNEVRSKLRDNWMPISVADEYGSGHYDYSETFVNVMAMFIDKAVKARLDADGKLRDIDPNTGYIAVIDSNRPESIPIKPYAEASRDERMLSPWYFDKEMAEAAVKEMMGNGPWTRAVQMVSYNNPDGSPKDFQGGLVKNTPYKMTPGTNELEFFPTLLDKIPDGWREGGSKLALSSDSTITMEYDNGPYIYLDENAKYHVKLNRAGSRGYLVARNPGDAKVMPAVQPTRFMIDASTLRDNPVQVPIVNPGDQKAGAVVTLPNNSTATEYVGYYVEHGPARVVGDKLEIQPLPANTAGPLEVELVAYKLTDRLVGMSSVKFNVSR